MHSFYQQKARSLNLMCERERECYRSAEQRVLSAWKMLKETTMLKRVNGGERYEVFEVKKK